MNYLADIQVGRLQTQGEIGNVIAIGTATSRFVTILSTTIGVLTLIAGIWFIFKIITGGIGIMSAGADKGKLAEARANITYGFTGLLVVVAAIFIAGIVGTVLGIDLLNLQDSIINLGTL